MQKLEVVAPNSPTLLRRVPFSRSTSCVSLSVRQQIDFEEFDMRIGIHTGTIIGGIIGTDIVRYDIYGRTGVHISAATKAIL